MQKAKEFLKNIIEGIVKHPDNLEVNASEDDMGIFLRVQVHKEDMGIIIGRAGVHASAIKLLAKLHGFSRGLKVSVKIEEPKEHE